LKAQVHFWNENSRPVRSIGFLDSVRAKRSAENFLKRELTQERVGDFEERQEKEGGPPEKKEGTEGGERRALEKLFLSGKGGGEQGEPPSTKGGDNEKRTKLLEKGMKKTPGAHHCGSSVQKRKGERKKIEKEREAGEGIRRRV